MRSNRLLVHFLVLVFMALCSLSAFGQRGNTTGTGGIHIIQGRVYLPNGRTPEVPVTVKLLSTNFSSIATDTDPGGSFMFHYLAPGSYNVVIEGNDQYESARENIVIDPEVKIEGMPSTVLPKIINVPIYLQFKKAVRMAAQVINAKLANIPKDAMKHYESGLKLSQAGKDEEALLELHQATTLYPDFPYAYSDIGKICLRLNKLDDAENAFRRALNTDPQDYDAKLNLGFLLLKKNEFAEAQEMLEDAKNINQTAAAPCYYLGLLYFSQHKLAEAKNAFESAEKLKSDKDYPKAHYYLGGIYWGEKQYKKAADELEKYLIIDPHAKDADQTRKAIEQLRSKEN
jgi:Tfp pilus assembly protein PilF